MNVSTAPPTTTGIIILSLLVSLIGIIIKGWFELKKVKKATTAVEHEVTPNSGKSLRDAVDNLHRSVKELDNKVAEQRDMTVEVRTQVNMMMTQGYRRRIDD